jgi:hypothetical protein
METITFKVQGSAAEPYITAFSRIGTKLTAHCSCPAGKVGQLCKHRLNILQGNASGIVSGNAYDVQNVLLWVEGTDVEDALRQFQKAENEFNEAKKQFDTIKRRLASALVVGNKSRVSA